MADGRMLKKTIANSKKLASVSDKAKVLWFMMLPHADIEGRVKACPVIVRGQYLTMLNYSLKAIQTALEDLHRAGLIILYEIGDNQYAEFTRFGDFQSLRADREAESTIPPPSCGSTPGVILDNSPLSKDKLSKDKLSKDNRLSTNFQKPTIKELVDYATSIKFLRFDAQQFLDFYESKGWMIGKNKMKCWKAAVRTWQKRSVESKTISSTKTKLFPIAGKVCCQKHCFLPAVYKSTAGAYDSYYCGEHMPESVKEKYTW